MHELERVAHRAFRSLYGENAVEAGGALCLRLDEAPDSPMLNRVVGLGLDAPASDDDIDAVLRAMEGVACYVAVSPFAAPADLAIRLDQRGLARGWGWTVFERDSAPVPRVDSALRVIEVGSDATAAWARIVRRAYGLPEAVEPFAARVARADGWSCWLALDGDEPVAGAALWCDGAHGYLGFAGTDPAHRGKGGQAALLAARIDHAGAQGCRSLLAETGEPLPGRPSDSYRNLVRYGFRERYVVAHRMRERAQA